MKIQSKTNYPDPTKFNGFLMWQSANKLEKQVNSALKPYDLNQSEMLHLISIFHLLTQNKTLTQAQLANFTGVTTMSVSKILTKLESRNFIKRQVGHDPRSKNITVTDDGLNFLRTCAPLMNGVEESFFPVSFNSELINILSQL